MAMTEKSVAAEVVKELTASTAFIQAVAKAVWDYSLTSQADTTKTYPAGTYVTNASKGAIHDGPILDAIKAAGVPRDEMVSIVKDALNAK